MRKLLSILLASALMTFSACSANTSAEETVLPDPSDAYIVAIKYMLSENDPQTTGIVYLSIDLSLVPDLTDEQKESVLSGLKLENIQVLDESYDALVEDGYIVGSVFTEGAFLTVTECEMSDSAVTMDLLLVMSDNNRIGYNGIRLDYLSGAWEISGYTTNYDTY